MDEPELTLIMDTAANRLDKATIRIRHLELENEDLLRDRAVIQRRLQNLVTDNLDLREQIVNLKLELEKKDFHCPGLQWSPL